MQGFSRVVAAMVVVLLAMSASAWAADAVNGTREGLRETSDATQYAAALSWAGSPENASRRLGAALTLASLGPVAEGASGSSMVKALSDVGHAPSVETVRIPVRRMQSRSALSLGADMAGVPSLSPSGALLVIAIGILALLSIRRRTF